MLPPAPLLPPPPRLAALHMPCIHLACPLSPPAAAVYKAGGSMTCKRQGEARSDLHTLAGASRLDNIRWVAGWLGGWVGG